MKVSLLCVVHFAVPTVQLYQSLNAPDALESSGSAALTWKFAANPVLPVFPASAVDLRATAARD